MTPQLRKWAGKSAKKEPELLMQFRFLYNILHVFSLKLTFTANLLKFLFHFLLHIRDKFFPASFLKSQLPYWKNNIIFQC